MARMSDKDRICRYGPADDKEMLLAALSNCLNILDNLAEGKPDEVYGAYQEMGYSHAREIARIILKENDFEPGWYYWGN